MASRNITTMPKVAPATKNAQKKQKKNQKKKANKARKVAILEDQNQIDTRVAAASSVSQLQQLTIRSVDKIPDAIATRGSQAIENLALGVVLAAIKRGWSAHLAADESTYIYAAYVYLVQAFYSAMAGTVPSLQSAPRWFWHITQALYPTTTTWKTSSITYRWKLEDGIQQQAPPPVSQMNILSVALGVPDLSLPKINGFYQLNTPVYNADVGPLAIKSLFEYWDNKGMTEIIPFEITTSQADVSTFSPLYPEFGSASGSPGALATTLFGEKYIQCPLYAKIAEYQTGDDWRGWSACGRGSGTVGYVLPRMTELKTARDLHNKLPPIFKFYDFDEFFEVLSLTVGFALERAAAGNTGTPPGPCPLTSLQVQILLRQTMIPAFSNEMAQDLVQGGPGLLDMFPLSVGMNGVSLTALTAPMKLPMLFAENIRACVRRLIRTKGGVLDMVPILARRSGPQQRNYTWSGGNVYSTDPDELDVDIRSLYYNDGATLKYFSANGPQLTSLSERWNEWITSLSTYLTPLTLPAQAPGPAIMSTLFLTRQVKFLEIPEAPAAQKTKRPMMKQASKKDLGTPFVPHRRLGQVNPSPDSLTFLSLGAYATTSMNTFLSPVWKYQRVMILPTCTAFVPNQGGALSYRQVFQVEPYNLSQGAISDDINFQGASDLLSLHIEMALLDVRTELAPPSEMQTEFAELAKLGGGGFLTSLAGAFGEDVLGIPGARQIAGAIGEFL